MEGLMIALLVGAALGAIVVNIIFAVVSRRLRKFELTEEENGKESN